MSSARKYRKSRFKSAVMRVVNKSAETKEVITQWKSNATLKHNVLYNLTDNAFKCDQGVFGQSVTSSAMRIGSKIFCKGLKVSIMIENQQYRPQVSYWLYLVRLKGGAMDDSISTKSEMFEGVSTTIPMDYIDTSKCDILYSKKFVVKMPNSGSSLALGGTVDGEANLESGGADYSLVTNPQTIQKLYVPINKTIVFREADEGTTNRQIPASYRYQWVMVSYNNFSTTTDGATYPVGHVSFTTIMKFTDV